MKKYTREELTEAYWHVPAFGASGGDYHLSYLPGLLRDTNPMRKWCFDAPYQRAVVWSEEQQSAFVGAFICGGMVPPGPPIILNIPGYGGVGRNGDPTWVVDGKQRLTALDRFVRGEIPANVGGDVGLVMAEQVTLSSYLIRTVAVDFTLRQQIRFYLKMNAGVPHSSADIEHARQLLQACRG